MREFDVNPGDMKLLCDIDDADIERLLAGRVPAGGDAADLIPFFHALGDVFPKQVDPELESGHVAAMVQVAQTAPVEPMSAPVATRHTIQARLVSLVNFRARLAAGSLAACTAFSGMAAAGVLPYPVQQAASKAAGAIGVSLPDGEREASSQAVHERPETNEAGPSAEDGAWLGDGAQPSQPSGDARSRASQGDDETVGDGSGGKAEASRRAEGTEPAPGEPPPFSRGAAPVTGVNPAPERDGSDDDDESGWEDDDEFGWEDDHDSEGSETFDDEYLEEDDSAWDDSYEEDEMEEQDSLADDE